MPIRFSTKAANADKLEADEDLAAPQAQEQGIGDASQRGNLLPDQGAKQGTPDTARPGKDINAAGFVKEREPQP